MIETIILVTNAIDFLGIAIADSAGVEIIFADGLGEVDEQDEAGNCCDFHDNKYFNYPNQSLSI